MNSNTRLFSPGTKVAGNTLEDGKIRLSVNLIESNIDVDYKYAFLIHVEFTNAEDVDVDNFRLNLVNYIVNLQFGKVYITKDDLSRKILTLLYPLFNDLENNLRSYVTKYLSVKEGVSSWFVRSVNDKVKDKIFRRKDNENLFSKIGMTEKVTPVDTQMFLIDFEDLGDIIYSNSFGNHNISDLVEKIISAEDLGVLKNSVQRNSDKYFQSFKDVSFDYKWKYLKDIRHKIAHNGLINLEEFKEAQSFSEDLIDFVSELNTNVAKIKFTSPDVDRAFYDYSAAHSTHYEDITKNELLRELRLYKEWSESIGRDFLSLKNFLHNRLGGAKGYHIGKAWDRLEELEKDGYIKIDIWKDPKGVYPDQKQIIIPRELPVYSI